MSSKFVKTLVQVKLTPLILFILNKGNCEWKESVKREIVLSDSSTIIELYSNKILECFYLIWEVKMGFSERLSNENNTCYSEIICVWNVVQGEKEMEKEIGFIKNNYEAAINSSYHQVEVPYLKEKNDLNIPYSYSKGKKLEEGTKKCKVITPADTSNGQLSLMKFFTLNDEMFNTLMNIERKNALKFNFRISELEHHYIHLHPIPNEAMILIGRSGTGKTTCCVYRMWNSYILHSKDYKQLFITRSSALMKDVNAMFDAMKKGTSHPTPSTKDINRIKDFNDEMYPIFTTIRSLFCLLDNSIKGEKFFSFLESKSFLKEDKKGLELLEELNSEDDKKTSYSRDKSCRREVTFELFKNEIYKEIQSDNKISPSLLWQEIKSYIKGSVESLNSPKGFISEEEYLNFGRKRSLCDEERRKIIYELFKKYENYKRMNRLYDEMDVIFNLANRKESDDEFIKMDEIYVDEVQDLTQSEIALIMNIIKDPNNLFLSGDTAQTISKGIGFRFEDIRSLFHCFSNGELKYHNNDSFMKIVTPKINQLSYNYRSHSNILNVAADTLKLLQYLFPDSIDKLEGDKGLFNGPNPIYINQHDKTKLLSSFQYNTRKDNMIVSSFGANRVLLVRNSESRDEMPEDLKSNLIMTIGQCKGLEFESVILYNFFTDSEYQKEWNIINKMVNEDNEITKNRPLNFDEKIHIVLINELKEFYTAITRARSTLYFFEENKNLNPLLKYFTSKGMIDIQDLVIIADAGSLDDISREWQKQGLNLLQRSQYDEAEVCFRNAYNNDMSELCKGIKLYINAKDSKKNKNMYIEAATHFAKIKDPYLLSDCLEKSGIVEETIFIYDSLKKKDKVAELMPKVKYYDDELYYISEKNELYVDSAHLLSMKDTNEFENYLLKCDDRTFRRYSMLYGLNDDIVNELRDDQLKIFTNEQLFKVYEDNGKIEIGIDKLIERNATEFALHLCLKYELEEKIINSNIFDSKTKLMASMRLLLKNNEVQNSDYLNTAYSLYCENQEDMDSETEAAYFFLFSLLFRQVDQLELENRILEAYKRNNVFLTAFGIYVYQTLLNQIFPMGELHYLLYYLQYSNPWKVMNQLKFCSIDVKGKYVTYQHSNPFLIAINQFSNLFLHKDIDINDNPFDKDNTAFSNTCLIFHFNRKMIENLLCLYDKIVEFNKLKYNNENVNEHDKTWRVSFFNRHYDLPYSLRTFNWKSTDYHKDEIYNSTTEPVELQNEEIELPKEIQERYDRISSYLSNSVQYLSNVTIDRQIPSTVKLLQSKAYINEWLDELQEKVENYKLDKLGLINCLNDIEKMLKDKRFVYRWKKYREELIDIDTPDDKIPDISKFIPIVLEESNREENIEDRIKDIVKEKKENDE